jgi:GPI-anchor transamidase subunit U
MGAEYLGSRVAFSIAFLTFASCLPRLRLLLPDLTPNPGLWWYFMTEMFDYFRPFFLTVFSVSEPFPEICPLASDLCIAQLHLVTYVAPLCIKFQ